MVHPSRIGSFADFDLRLTHAEVTGIAQKLSRQIVSIHVRVIHTEATGVTPWIKSVNRSRQNDVSAQTAGNLRCSRLFEYVVLGAALLDPARMKQTQVIGGRTT